MLVADRETADYFEAAVRHGGAKRDAKAVANWIMGDLSALRQRARRLRCSRRASAPASLAALVDLIGEGVISGKIAKDVLLMLLGDDKGADPRELVKARGLRPGQRSRRDRKGGRCGHRSQRRQGRTGEDEAGHARLVRWSGDEDDGRQSQSASRQRRAESEARTRLTRIRLLRITSSFRVDSHAMRTIGAARATKMCRSSPRKIRLRHAPMLRRFETALRAKVASAYARGQAMRAHQALRAHAARPTKPLCSRQALLAFALARVGRRICGERALRAGAEMARRASMHASNRRRIEARVRRARAIIR